jgi:hypothetical protein
MTKYHNQGVAFLTQHGKEFLVRDALEEQLGCRLIHTDAYDTDQLGTFTGDIQRQGSQLDAARQKAKIGMSLTQLRIGLASEGAFGADPFGGLMPWNTELLLWVDEERQLEIKGVAQGPAQSSSKLIESLEQLDSFASEAQFPSHYLNLRSEDQHHTKIHKGLKDRAALVDAFREIKKAAPNSLLLVENDLRAFGNPTRQGVIRNALKDLLRQLKSLCPQCDSPGYWINKTILGLPCQSCGNKTRCAIGQQWHCPSCLHTQYEELPIQHLADASICDVCNP